MGERIGTWIGLISTTVTVLLTVLNFQLNSKLNDAEVALKDAQRKLMDAESNLKHTTAELEVSREKTERYEFVNKLLPDVLASDETRVVLTSNLIALALTEEEAQKLFAGLSFSDVESVQSAGQAGIETIRNRKSKYEQAKEYETAGVNALINGDLDLALASFDSVEQTYPTFHWAYEITMLLRKNRGSFAEESVRKSILGKIANDYSTWIPDDKLAELKRLSR